MTTRAPHNRTTSPHTAAAAPSPAVPPPQQQPQPMRSSLFAQQKPQRAQSEGHAARMAVARADETAIEQENDVMLKNIGDDMNRLKREAGLMHEEVKEHNKMLDLLQDSLKHAASGVRGVASRLDGVMKAHGWKGTVAIAAVIFLLLLGSYYFVIYLVKRPAVEATPVPTPMPTPVPLPPQQSR
jgi:hypothetical protein